MTTLPLKIQKRAFPPYFGGKHRLLSWIKNVLVKFCPPGQWAKMDFADLFMGGGAMSMWAKAHGFNSVQANDAAFRAEIIATGLLKNTSTLLSHSDMLRLTQPLPDEPGFIEQEFALGVFSRTHAKQLDRGFYWARLHPDPYKRALSLITMWHLANKCVAFSTSLGGSNAPFAKALDGEYDWEDINPKRFTDGSLISVCKPVFSDLERIRVQVNGGVMGGAPFTFTRMDALERLLLLHAHLLYIDPPYADTVSYERSNAVLDSLLLGHLPKEKPAVSDFSRGIDALDNLLANAGHIPIWMLSYGNKAISLPELEDLVKAHADGRTVQGYSKPYTHLSHVSKRNDSQELLVVAYPKGGI